MRKKRRYRRYLKGLTLPPLRFIASLTNFSARLHTYMYIYTYKFNSLLSLYPIYHKLKIKTCKSNNIACVKIKMIETMNELWIQMS
uniref:Uncharacterized protein n=1 Tax=Rhizophora mucronata TaxID=61149 RepID=A0A2P2NT18_RHIMU